MEYYLFDFAIRNNHYYCVAYMDDKDGFLANQNILLAFLSTHELIEYCKNNNIYLQDEEVSVCNINNVLNWYKNCNLTELNCDIMLWFWNAVQDVAYSIHEYFYGNEDGVDNEILYVYNQLFYGTNPEAMRSKEDELYYPQWDEDDIEIIKNVVKDGFRILEKALLISIF